MLVLRGGRGAACASCEPFVCVQRVDLKPLFRQPVKVLTHIHTHTHTRTHTQTQTHTHLCTYTHTHTHTCIGTDKTGSRTDTDDGTGAKEDRRTNPNVSNDSLHSTLLIPNSSPLNLNPHTPRPKPTTPQTPHPKPAEPRVGKLRVVNRR